MRVRLVATPSQNVCRVFHDPRVRHVHLWRRSAESVPKKLPPQGSQMLNGVSSSFKQPPFYLFRQIKRHWLPPAGDFSLGARSNHSRTLYAARCSVIESRNDGHEVLVDLSEAIQSRDRTVKTFLQPKN